MQYGSLYKRGKCLSKQHLLWYFASKSSYRIIKLLPFSQSLRVSLPPFKLWKTKIMGKKAAMPCLHLGDRLFQSGDSSAFHGCEWRNVSLVYWCAVETCCHTGTRQELGFVKYRDKRSRLWKRKRSQPAEKEVAFKHAQSAFRAFEFITMQYDQFLLPSLSKSLMF